MRFYTNKASPLVLWLLEVRLYGESDCRCKGTHKEADRTTADTHYWELPTFQFYYYKVHIPGIPNGFSMNVPEFVDG